MSKIVFLLCVAIVAQNNMVSGGALNSENPKVHPIAVTAEESETNSLINETRHESNADLLHKVNATEARVGADFLKIVSESMKVNHEQQLIMQKAAEHAINELNNIFKRGNDSAKEYYGDHKKAKKCGIIVGELQQQIDHHAAIFNGCVSTVVMTAADSLRGVSSIPVSVREDLSQLYSLAFSCNNDEECDAVNKGLDAVNKKMLEFANAYHDFNAQFITRAANLDNKCIHLSRIAEQYEKTVNERFEEFKSCMQRNSP